MYPKFRDFVNSACLLINTSHSFLYLKLLVGFFIIIIPELPLLGCSLETFF